MKEKLIDEIVWSPTRQEIVAMYGEEEAERWAYKFYQDLLGIRLECLGRLV